jgi:hypothetical protein
MNLLDSGEMISNSVLRYWAKQFFRPVFVSQKIHVRPCELVSLIRSAKLLALGWSTFDLMNRKLKYANCEPGFLTAKFNPSAQYVKYIAYMNLLIL